MQLAKTVFSNTSYQVLSRTVIALGTLFGTALIARALGASTYGEYAIVTAYVMTFFMISDFGVNAIVVRDFAENNDEIYSKYSKILALRIVFGLFITLIALGILLFIPYDENIKTAILISMPIILFNSIYKSQEIIYQSKLQYKNQFISAFSMALVSVLLLYGFISYGGEGIVRLMLVVMLGWSVAPFVGWFFTKGFINFNTTLIDRSYWWYVIKDAFPIGIALIINVLMINADRFMLSIMDTPTSVGIYHLAYKIFELLIIVPTFMMNALYPIMAKQYDGYTDKFLKLVNVSIGMLFIIGIIITLMVLGFSRNIIQMIWGNELSIAYIPLSILTIGLALFYVSAPLNRVAVLVKKQNYLPLIYFAALVLNILLNLIFIPIYSYNGAAVVTVISELMALIGLYLLVGRDVLRFRQIFNIDNYRTILKDKL